jgi:hypothetical protein
MPLRVHDHDVLLSIRVSHRIGGVTVLAEDGLVASLCVPEASALRAVGFGFEAPAMFQHRRGCFCCVAK